MTSAWLMTRRSVPARRCDRLRASHAAFQRATRSPYRRPETLLAREPRPLQLVERRARIADQRQRAACLQASNSATLILMKRTAGFWNAVFDAVVKSLSACRWR